MSFANRADDVRLMRRLCGPGAEIIFKIESPAGVRNLDGILEVADEILIDRGDLSRRVPIEQIPFLQRRIIAMARSRGWAVYVATNLSESMVTTQSPNRAEVNDVVSTLEMGASGLVLAAETAIGNYPVEAVAMVRALISGFENWHPGTSISELLGD
jgi:pyruvate kinase